jgi:hypothetical protein
MESVIKGKVVSFSTRRAGASCRKDEYPWLKGWVVNFRFPCLCGHKHSTQARQVWTNGTTDVVKVECPDTKKPVEVELIQPPR